MTGGFDGASLSNDIYSSTDGISWTLESIPSPFPPRVGHEMIKFKGKLHLYGGYTHASNNNPTSDNSGKKILNDTWTSTDGINWTDVTPLCKSTFSSRFNFKIVNLFDLKLILVGGTNANLEVLNDVWKSNDGINWTLITKNANFSPRTDFTFN